MEPNTSFLEQLGENAVTAAAGAVSLVMVGESANVLAVDWSVIGMAAGGAAFLSIVKSLAARKVGDRATTFFIHKKPGRYERI